MAFDGSVMQRLEGGKGRCRVESAKSARDEGKVDVAMGEKIMTALIP